VVSRTDSATETKRIGDLRRRQPGDSTLRNLLGTLDAKLDLCASLPVYEWEAGREGHPESAAMFHALAEIERRSCGQVLDELKRYLECHTHGEEDCA
jgi:hypothetical protein